jgi:hypothetical protein
MPGRPTGDAVRVELIRGVACAERRMPGRPTGDAVRVELVGGVAGAEAGAGPSHGGGVRLESGPDGWHGENFSLPY